MNKEHLDLIRKSYEFSLNLHQELTSKIETEDFEDTLTRKYEEGFSDAIAHVFNILGISVEESN